MGKRFAIVLGVAATGAMALGAQPATSTTGPVDRVPPDLRLSGPKKDDPQNDGAHLCDGGDCNVNVKASCGDEKCITRATGKLTHVNRDKLTPEISVVQPGQRFNVGPELAKEAQRKQVRKALAEGKNVKAKVTVRAKDAAGNVATRHRTIKLR